MVRLRKGMTIIGPNNKRGVVTGWGAGNVYASLAGGNPDIDYFAWPRSWLSMDSRGMARVIQRSAKAPPTPAQREMARVLQNWRHNAPADL